MNCLFNCSPDRASLPHCLRACRHRQASLLFFPEGGRLGSGSGYKTRGSTDNGNKYVKPRIHYIQLIPNAKDTTSSESDPNKGVWFAADDLKSGPELFGLTQERFLFFTGKKIPAGLLSLTHFVAKGLSPTSPQLQFCKRPLLWSLRDLTT